MMVRDFVTFINLLDVFILLQYLHWRCRRRTIVSNSEFIILMKQDGDLIFEERDLQALLCIPLNTITSIALWRENIAPQKEVLILLICTVDQ